MRQGGPRRGGERVEVAFGRSVDREGRGGWRSLRCLFDHDFRASSVAGHRDDHPYLERVSIVVMVDLLGGFDWVMTRSPSFFFQNILVIIQMMGCNRCSRASRRRWQNLRLPNSHGDRLRHMS